MPPPDTEFKQPAPGTVRRLRNAVRRASQSVLAGWRRGTNRFRPHAPDDLARRWEWIATSLLKFGGASEGNSVAIHCDGDQCLEAIWQAIAQATSRIWLEMYTIEPDRVGTRTIRELTLAAQRGCEVVLLYDAVGSLRLGETHLKPLRDAGARIEAFNPIRRWWRGHLLLRRDHRKIIVIDGSIGFCGGMNISEDYAGTKHGNCRFHDCLVRMEGPCVRDLAAVFASSWRLRKDERLPLPQRSPPAGSVFAQVLSSRGALGRRTIQRSLRLTIRHAGASCFITTPYFVPPPRLMRAIIRAAERGVDVRILTAGDCDVPIVRVAAQHIYGSLLRKGVRLYEMRDCTLHAKTIVIDGLFSVVGSFNLDTWSDKRNLESNIAMLDARVAGDVQAAFQRDISSATQITLDAWRKRRWWQRILNWLAYQLLSV